MNQKKICIIYLKKDYTTELLTLQNIPKLGTELWCKINGEWYRGTFVEGNSTEIKVQFSDGAQIIIPNTGDNIKIPSRWNLLLESIFHDIAQLKLAYGRIGEEEYSNKNVL